MASPFKFFRKHQTQLLVVIGILTMIAFIILPSILQQLDVAGRIRPASTIVETQKYGSLSTDELRRLKYNQSILANFFQGILKAYSDQLSILQQGQRADFDKVLTGYSNAAGLLNQVGDNSINPSS